MAIFAIGLTLQLMMRVCKIYSEQKLGLLTKRLKNTFIVIDRGEFSFSGP